MKLIVWLNHQGDMSIEHTEDRVCAQTELMVK